MTSLDADVADDVIVVECDASVLWEGEEDACSTFEATTSSVVELGEAYKVSVSSFTLHDVVLYFLSS